MSPVPIYREGEARAEPRLNTAPQRLDRNLALTDSNGGATSLVQPFEIVEVFLFESEMVSQLVDHGGSNLAQQLGASATQLFVRSAEYRDHGGIRHARLLLGD